MDQSPLGRLSAELRNRIAELALRQEEPIIVNDRHAEATSGHTSTSKKTRKKDNRHLLAYSSTCKQLRNETLHLFYNINVFSIKSDTSLEQPLKPLARNLASIATRLKQFEKQIGPQAFGAIHHMQFVRQWTRRSKPSKATGKWGYVDDMAETFREWMWLAGVYGNQAKTEFTAKFEGWPDSSIAPDLSFDLREPRASWEKNMAAAGARYYFAEIQDDSAAAAAWYRAYSVIVLACEEQLDEELIV